MTGRPIYIGEGLIPLIEAFASKFVYNNKPTLQLFNHIMAVMREKALDDTGNVFHIICNSKFWDDINLVLSEYLANFKTDGAYLYSKAANKGAGGYIEVGATFNAYTFAGNTVVFSVDRTLSREYGNDKGFAMCLDLTADKTTNTPAIAKFSLLNREFITNKIAGVKYTTCAA